MGVYWDIGQAHAVTVMYRYIVCGNTAIPGNRSISIMDIPINSIVSLPFTSQSFNHGSQSFRDRAY